MENVVPSTPYRKVLVAFDGSAGSLTALRRALLLCGDSQVQITAFSVNEAASRHAPGVGEVREESEVRDAYFAGLRSQAEAVARELGAVVGMDVAEGHAAQSIVRHAQDHGFDLIVIGHTGHSGIWGTLLGSTTARVVDQASCDVLVAR